MIKPMLEKIKKSKIRNFDKKIIKSVSYHRDLQVIYLE